MRLRSRSWSIRTRTAVAFAVAFAVLATALLVFVNLTSVWALAVDLADGDTASSIAASASPMPVRGDGATGDGGPRTGSAVSTVRLVRSQLGAWSAIGVGIAAVAAGLIGWLVSRRMLRPVDDIARAAARISASTLHERIDLHGPDDELRRLSDTIDALIGRLERSFASQRRFVAQASHELRTPLAVQRAAIQIGLDEHASPSEIAAARTELLEQNRRTERLVERLLVLAEAERGLDDVEPIDLAALARDTAAEFGGSARDAGVTIVEETRMGPPRCVGDPLLVRQALRNLVDNAIEYNAAPWFVEIRTDADGMTVENSGPLVDAPRELVEPFRRGDVATERRHNGVGLSVVDAVVRAHGWCLTLTAREGGGLVARIDISSM